MTFSEAITSCMGKYATFKGRASRSEYWWFFLFSLLLGWAASVVGYTVNSQWGPNLLNGMVNLALFLPALAVGTRRLHDIGKSGWWQLLLITIIGIIPVIVWWSRNGTSDSNEYGDTVVSTQLPSTSNV